MKNNRSSFSAHKRFWTGMVLGFFFVFIFLFGLALCFYFRDTYAGRNRTNENDLLSIANDSFRNKNYEKSKIFYLKVLKINPNNYDANFYLGSLYNGYLEPHDYKKGLYYTEKAVSFKKDDENLMYEARNYLNNGQFPEAEKIIRKCLSLKINKDKSDVWEKLGYVLKMQDEFKESLKAYQKAQTLNPADLNIQHEIDALPINLN